MVNNIEKQKVIIMSLDQIIDYQNNNIYNHISRSLNCSELYVYLSMSYMEKFYHISEKFQVGDIFPNEFHETLCYHLGVNNKSYSIKKLRYDWNKDVAIDENVEINFLNLQSLRKKNYEIVLVCNIDDIKFQYIDAKLSKSKINIMEEFTIVRSYEIGLYDRNILAGISLSNEKFIGKDLDILSLDKRINTIRGRQIRVNNYDQYSNNDSISNIVRESFPDSKAYQKKVRFSDIVSEIGDRNCEIAR